MVTVGICGASGSGKSTLAGAVKAALPCDTLIIGQDCYYKDYPHKPIEQRRLINYDEPEAFDHDGLYLDVLALSRGESILKKGYDYANHRRADTAEAVSAPDVLILEGIHIFFDPRLRELMDLRIYMYVDKDICLLRRIKRDICERGRNIENISAQYLKTVKPMYEKYVSGYIDEADFAVMRGGENRAAAEAVTAYVRALLQGGAGAKENNSHITEVTA